MNGYDCLVVKGKIIVDWYRNLVYGKCVFLVKYLVFDWFIKIIYVYLVLFWLCFLIILNEYLMLWLINKV